MKRIAVNEWAINITAFYSIQSVHMKSNEK